MTAIQRHEDMPLPDLARAAAASRFFKVDPAQAIVKVLMGRELGVPPIASLTDIHVIQGKPVIGAGMIAARIKSSAKYNYKCRKSTAERCDLEFFEEGESQGIHSYTIEQAKRAGLAGKDNWRKHADDMLFARAISTGYKRYCPDVFSSKVYVPGEIDDSAPLPATVTTVTAAAPKVITQAAEEPDQAPAEKTYYYPPNGEQEPAQAPAEEPQREQAEEPKPEPTPTPAPRRRRRRAAV